MPSGGIPFSVGFQGEDLVLWALVEPANPKIQRAFAVLPTGLDYFPHDHLELIPIGTAVHSNTSGGLFPHGTVWHVFEVTA